MRMDNVEKMLDGSSILHTMQVFLRDKKYFFYNQKPVALIFSDKGLFFGGSSATKDLFEHIPLAKVIDLRVCGRWVFKSLKLSFEKDGKIKYHYITPFSGEPENPGLDLENIDFLEKSLKQVLTDMGVRI